ncbi:2-amino-4-hydroxy-6-hydroxymethyldihydropteridine diphosphokinase [Ehrlichia chaffeensis str. Heartland]|uniref:2-amino-4-hydroxy-6-hydroxymethyldihydropteridine pyrophosphokinase n=1 Tax=Ehrlichia chaffeensis (strain ATCC CRL-10679 / Arkansas) TaxID=205920 RepID=Q2GHB3_EHRCR|nr:2-amino-4-hydroxy-6-hydroxymethyldihydropteridine diphosphokinase [Ehrlichia chaffeensis]ABD45103.1 2-amino-4-hydroxy-6-hydroxymethyldihydropteridine-pyrophosphokinase [Ehrlichia chaffeensis str. Arkansas]AHX03463.1 2-amino-4-hydroxy-6-hydroxymethyldihydropteridine diphosphokinase [Ehrlichia chaffeensis str. Heartland]AHX05817.1 2-amino-4-hydroxy-6-hydroxymethyldihydropteridine diphosphokinase [Ehrlichia chaffeensis str. Jax]AHX06809.1 2-amino-4-hydroxy-6-hydroxymethyldihydropteridine diphos
MFNDVVMLALGSNCGNMLAYIKSAINMLPLHNKNYSYLYKTPALLPENAADHWDTPYLNMVVSGYTNLSSSAMLERIKSIEKMLGRINHQRWAPRPIDIDIILWGNKVVDSQTLSIPHQQMHCRDFVLVPLCDIYARFIHPVLQIPIYEMLLSLNNINLIKQNSHVLQQ